MPGSASAFPVKVLTPSTAGKGPLHPAPPSPYRQSVSSLTRLAQASRVGSSASPRSLAETSQNVTCSRQCLAIRGVIWVLVRVFVERHDMVAFQAPGLAATSATIGVAAEYGPPGCLPSSGANPTMVPGH